MLPSISRISHIDISHLLHAVAAFQFDTSTGRHEVNEIFNDIPPVHLAKSADESPEHGVVDGGDTTNVPGILEAVAEVRIGAVAVGEIIAEGVDLVPVIRVLVGLVVVGVDFGDSIFEIG